MLSRHAEAHDFQVPGCSAGQLSVGMKNALHCIESEECVSNRMANTVVASHERRQEFEEIISRALASFRQTAVRWVGNREDAEDAVQDAMLSAFRNIAQFDGRSQMSTWLTAIVINAARMQLRQRLRVRWLPLDFSVKDGQRTIVELLADPAPDPEQSLTARELRELVNNATVKLSCSQRTAMRLRLGGLSVQEMAKTLGVPVGTVKARLARARAELKRRVHRAAGRFAAQSSKKIRRQGMEHLSLSGLE
jgi:RNA polymerase sigma-70 factor (ECF subfamily)